MPKQEKRLPSDYPKQCPHGHKHLSWSLIEKEVFCWDCNHKYALSECFGSRAVRTPTKTPKKQLKLFKPDGEARNDLDQALGEEKSNE